MKLPLILLMYSGLIITVYGAFGYASTISIWSDSYGLFESLGDTNPLKSKEFSEKYDKWFLSGQTWWTPVIVSGLVVTALSFWGLIRGGLNKPDSK